jgi:ubiquinone/menaquinone biosynthesis C-methylase UbiE
MTATTLKAYRGMGMEGSIARWYEKTTGKDMEQFRKLARRLESVLPPGDVLEVAPGPGFLSIELARSGKYKVTGLDISRTFIELARKNAAKAGVEAEFRLGNASRMPFEDNSFDLLVCRAAFKNFSEPGKALAEMYRVLRPGGTGLIIDLRRDTPISEIANYVNNMEVGALSRWFTMFTFRHMLLKRAYTKPEFEQMLAGIPFSKKEVRIVSLGLEVWTQK